MKKLNGVSNKAKNLGPVLKTPSSNGLKHHVPDPVIPKKAQNKELVVSARRSARLQSVIKPVENQPYEEINLVDSKGEEANADVERPLPFIDTIVKAVDELTPKGAPEEGAGESTLVSLYKGLYMHYQKKVESLTLENHRLTRKLEIALGKLEVYEDVNHTAQADLMSNLKKAIQALVRPTPDVGQVSSFGGRGAGDGGAAAKEPSPKKRKLQANKRVRYGLGRAMKINAVDHMYNVLTNPF
ncbi:hypothetical protein CTI12_AA297190 [Artemisia annua]|uniref:Uncharacterized protein n=1 Tax=Artemisia annua TaxID=35608 RepID=A0A2U1N5U8_ARTAN|nr:hypothetical protein CTI12_AA297190 [Artemisia annua]